MKRQSQFKYGLQGESKKLNRICPFFPSVMYEKKFASVFKTVSKYKSSSCCFSH